MGASNWIEGGIMLGHFQPDISDRYAPYSAAYLVNALTFTQRLIDRIE
ncbi:hypothetical protein [Croceicoccus mobilis]|uniref:Uncharacterized protein n=1 Tax=Croceicoccus mobilis TaxID=1703339 RepID=A0A916YTL2_9SPHN|nr:hypothetical protein [Croceicoccus mobilis]GGD60844.1 hypothetical protein GCM10010990_07930 [Croceicoccus mobilis]